jgi:sulfate permease, SulP family
MSKPRRLRLLPEWLVPYRGDWLRADLVAHKIEPLIREAQPKVVAVNASGVLDLEYTALKIFAKIAKIRSQHGVQLWLVGMNPGVLAIIQRSPLGQMLQRERMHFNLEIAVARYLSNAAVLNVEGSGKFSSVRTVAE